MNPNALPNAVGLERSDVPIYFLHIPKTGGTTLSSFLETLYLNSEFWHGGIRTSKWSEILRLNPEDVHKAKVINGHFGGYFYKYMPYPLRYVTLLRDPLQRALSHHGHVLRDGQHYLHSLAKELGTFGAYLRDERTQPTIVNFQLRSVGATLDAVEFAKTLTPEQVAQDKVDQYLDTTFLEQPVADLLSTARSRLDQMCFVGLTERFDESLALLCELFAWPMATGVEPRNINPSRASIESIPNDDLRLLSRLNEADIDFYQSAKSRFERDWARSRFVYPRLHAFISYAQNGEDVLLHRVLRHVNCGTYIDIGANDPSGDSVTKAFYDRGWRGINIEPAAAMYEALVRYRPHDVNIQAAVGAKTCTKTFYEIPGTGLSTLDSRIADRHRRQGFKVNEQKVRIRTLKSIVAKFCPNEIHFLKIDVEGWERAVLQGIDLTTIRPWIILIEATEPNTETPSYADWEPLLLDNGYSFVFFDGLNRFYLANEKMDLQVGFSHPVCSGDVYIKASEDASAKSLREAQWALRRHNVLFEQRQAELSDAQERARVALSQYNAIELERDGLRREVSAHVAARAVEREEAIRQIEALTKWATSADVYGKSLLTECEELRISIASGNVAREAERSEAIAQIKAWAERATASETYAKSLVEECTNLRDALSEANNAREAERLEAIVQINAWTERATASETYASSLIKEGDRLRDKLENIQQCRETEQQETATLRKTWTDAVASAQMHCTSLTDEIQRLRDTLQKVNAARESERLESAAQLEGWTRRAEAAEARVASLADERMRLIEAATESEGARRAERIDAAAQLSVVMERLTSAEGVARFRKEEYGRLCSSLKQLKGIQEAERIRAALKIKSWTLRATSAEQRKAGMDAELSRWKETYRQEVESRKTENDEAKDVIQKLTSSLQHANIKADSLFSEIQRIRKQLDGERGSWSAERAAFIKDVGNLRNTNLALERALKSALEANAELRLELLRERRERTADHVAWEDHRDAFEANAQALVARLRETAEEAAALRLQMESIREKQALATANWRTERDELDNSLIALEEFLAQLQRHWAVRLLVGQRFMARIWEKS